VQRIVVEQRIVDAVHHDDRRVDELVDPLWNSSTRTPGRSSPTWRWVGDRKVERQRRGVVRLGLEDRVDDGVDVGVAVVEGSGQTLLSCPNQVIVFEKAGVIPEVSSSPAPMPSAGSGSS